MNLTRRPKLSIEQLEHRDCPSFVITLAGGTLFVRGTPTETGTPNLLFTQTANNVWQVKDATHNLGTYAVSNINLSVTNHINTPISFNLNGNTSTGNLFINLGTGDNSGSAAKGLALYNGTLAGNVTVLNGSGRERVLLGFEDVTDTTPGVTIGGDVLFNGKSNSNLTTSGGLADGNLLDTGLNTPSGASPVVRIGGSVTALNTAATVIAAKTTVGKDVTITSLHNVLSINDFGPNIYGNVGGNVTITGSSGSASGNARDVIFIGDGIAGDTATIGGNLSITTTEHGTKPNVVQFSNPTVVNGNTFIQTGDGNNALSLDANFAGNVNLQLGNGVNTDTSADSFPAAFFPTTASVAGNFNLTAGNGNNNLTTTGKSFAGTVGGNTFITLGNGNDSPFTVSSKNLGGTFNWRSGNGNDSLSLTGATLYNVAVQFGNGDDTFNLGAGVTLTGRVDGGGRITGNTFNTDPASTIVSPFTLSNFP